MAKILVAAELKTNSPESRQGVIDHLTKASKYANEKEPGVYRYMICLPADESDTTTVWAIEEYADKQALDSHMETQPVKDMIAYMSSNPVLEGAPTINQLSWVNNMEFTKPEAGQQKDPFIVFGEIDWQEGKRDGTLEHWKANVDSSKNESGCFTYGVSKKDDSPNTLYTLEMYPNEQYLWDVHCNTEAIKETIAQTKHLRTNVKLNKLKLHGGYAYKNK